MNYEEMTLSGITQLIKTITMETKKKYKQEIDNITKELKNKCKEEINEKTIELKKICQKKRSKEFYNENYKVDKITQRDAKANEMFNKNFKELEGWQQKKVVGAIQTQHRREVKARNNGKIL